MATKVKKKAKKEKKEDEKKTIEFKGFLIISFPEKAQPGDTLRLLGLEKSLAAAQKAIPKLGPNVLGQVAVMECKTLYVRQTAVENIVVNNFIT